MIKEFKEFISKGNVMDMAVGIIIGGAFTAIVNSLVESILMPIIGAISGGKSVADMSVMVGNAAIGYGAFIQAIIDFLLIAWVLFMIIKALNKAKAAVVKEEEPAPEEPEEVPAMITGFLLAVLAIAYVLLKVSNTRAEFARRDAQRQRELQEAEAAMEEMAEEEEIRRSAVDVEAETIDNADLDAEEFTVEPSPESEEGVVIEVPEYETV